MDDGERDLWERLREMRGSRDTWRLVCLWLLAWLAYAGFVSATEAIRGCAAYNQTARP